MNCAKCKRKIQGIALTLGDRYYGKNTPYFCRECVIKWCAHHDECYYKHYGNPLAELSASEWKQLFEEWLGWVKPEKVVFT